MGYNIDRSITQKLEDLVIPMEALCGNKINNLPVREPVILDMTTMMIRVDLMESRIEGNLKDGNIHVTTISIQGTASGSYYEEILKPALRQSKGKFTARLVWESGDSINLLVVKDGELLEVPD